MGCFVYLYAHLFVLELLEERRYTVQPLACHVTLCKSSKLSELWGGKKVIIRFLKPR